MSKWGTLYARIRADILERIRAEAEKEEMSMAMWVGRHFRDYFAAKDKENGA